jgi:hypothetical protein
MSLSLKIFAVVVNAQANMQCFAGVSRRWFDTVVVMFEWNNLQRSILEMQQSVFRVLVFDYAM